MMSETDSDGVELSAGLSEDEVRADEASRPDDTERLEIIRLMGQLGAGDTILWNERKQPLTVVRRVTSDDLRGQCLNFRLAGRKWAAQCINSPMFDGDEDRIKSLVGGVFLTGEFGEEFLLVRGPRGGLYRLSVAYSERRGRHIPVFQNRVRARKHKGGRFRSSDAWDGMGTEVLRLARVGHDGDVDPDAVDPDDRSAFVGLDDLSGRSVLGSPEGSDVQPIYEFTDADVDAGVVPREVSDYAGQMSTNTEDADVGVYAARGGVTLDLSEYADTEPEDLPMGLDTDRYVSVERGEDGGIHVTEVPERVHHRNISEDRAHIAEVHDSARSKTPKVCFGSSYPVFVERGGKDAVKTAPSAAYDGNRQRWVVDGEDLQTALDALLDVEGVDAITAPPMVLKYLTE